MDGKTIHVNNKVISFVCLIERNLKSRNVIHSIRVHCQMLNLILVKEI